MSRQNTADIVYPESFAANAASLEGVRGRRLLAFLLDYTIVGVLWLVAIIPVFVLGFVTFGLAWLLYPALGAMLALLYLGITLSGASQATWGMALFSIKLEREDGQLIDFPTAIVHGVLFWAIHIAFTPAMALVCLFTAKKQLIHDLLLGTLVARSSQ